MKTRGGDWRLQDRPIALTNSRGYHAAVDMGTIEL